MGSFYSIPPTSKCKPHYHDDYAYPFVSCQEEYSLLRRSLDREMMPMLQSYGLGLIPFAPLAMGLLTGKYKRGAPPPEGARLSYMPPAAARYLN